MKRMRMFQGLTQRESGVTPGCTEYIMLTFLCLDEEDRNTLHLFQLVRNLGKCNASDDKSVRYYDNDDWPAHAPVGMWYGLVNDFMREWRRRKEQLKNGESTDVSMKINKIMFGGYTENNPPINKIGGNTVKESRGRPINGTL